MTAEMLGVPPYVQPADRDLEINAEKCFGCDSVRSERGELVRLGAGHMIVWMCDPCWTDCWLLARAA